MVENKTKPTAVSVDEFLGTVPNAKRRADGIAADEFFRKHTGLEPVMWGPSMVGYGAYHYRYASGHEGDAMIVGFAPRSTSLVFYGLSHEMAEQLGPHTAGKGCLYVKDFSALDLDVLGRMVDAAFADRA